MLQLHLAYRVRRTLLLFVCLSVLLGCAPIAEPAPTPETESRVVWELVEGEQYSGLVQLAALAAGGELVHMATSTTLYTAADGKAVPIAQQVSPDAELALAPGGTLYAWLVPQPEWMGLFSVSLHDIDGRQTAELKLDQFPYGFTALYLGFEGRTIVTASPLSNWETLAGPVLYSFWSREGELLGQQTFDELQAAFLDPAGSAVIFLGSDRASAWSGEGQALWQTPGAYRNAAISENAGVALLNGAEGQEIAQIVLLRGGDQLATLELPAPAHQMALTPDGARGVVTVDGGRYALLDMQGGLEEFRPLPVEGYLFVADVEWLDGETLAFGVQRGVGEGNERQWPSASVLAVDLSGKLLFEKSFPQSMPLSGFPSLDVRYGSATFVGRTIDRVFLVQVAR